MSALDQLAPYGFSLDAEGHIVSPTGKVTGVTITEKRGRLLCRDHAGALLFSGHDLGRFLERFWFAERIA